MTHRSVVLAGCLMGIAVWMSGCSGGGGDAPTLAAIKGKVVSGGAPVANATVMFFPEKGPSGMGITAADGTFTITTNGRPGAPIGMNKVTVAKSVQGATAAPKVMKPEDMRNMQIASGGVTPIAESEVPESYQNPTTTPLTADVTADPSKNEFEFPIVK